MKLIVGLGNPGGQYKDTRHNVGFEVARLLAQKFGSAAPRGRFQGETVEAGIAGQKVLLLTPLTYMNLSGQSVGAAVKYYKIPTEHVLVAYDELDLPPGRMQLRFAGSSAGHKGIGSIIEHIGTEFWRLRFGVGHPRDSEHSSGDRKDVIDHVLKRAGGDEEDLLLENLRRAVDALPVLLEHGAERAKNLLHTRKPETK